MTQHSVALSLPVLLTQDRWLFCTISLASGAPAVLNYYCSSPTPPSATPPGRLSLTAIRLFARCSQPPKVLSPPQCKLLLDFQDSFTVTLGGPGGPSFGCTDNVLPWCPGPHSSKGLPTLYSNHCFTFVPPPLDRKFLKLRLVYSPLYSQCLGHSNYTINA